MRMPARSSDAANVPPLWVCTSNRSPAPGRTIQGLGGEEAKGALVVIMCGAGRDGKGTPCSQPSRPCKRRRVALSVDGTLIAWRQASCGDARGERHQARLKIRGPVDSDPPGSRVTAPHRSSTPGVPRSLQAAGSAIRHLPFSRHRRKHLGVGLVYHPAPVAVGHGPVNPHGLRHHEPP